MVIKTDRLHCGRRSVFFRSQQKSEATGLELCTNGVSCLAEIRVPFTPLFHLLADLVGILRFAQNCKWRWRLRSVARTRKRVGSRQPFFWYGQQDLNLHISRYKILNLARLPISPCPHSVCLNANILSRIPQKVKAFSHKKENSPSFF